MGNNMEKPSNKIMVDRLVQKKHIRTPLVESVFRAVDRAMYFEMEEDEAIDPYGDEPWRLGNLHLSAPCIYANVVEALDLKSGLSFLNLGSGTGYLNTIVGLLVGPHGINHGIELHSEVVDYACKHLKQFKEKSYAIDKFDFSEPIFIEGNCVNLNPNSSYDRIYLGAACLPDFELFMKKLIKSNGGILVMPCGAHLMRYIRLTDDEWKSEKLMDVSFTSMIGQGDNESIIDMPLSKAKSLKELCRVVIRKQLRDKTDSTNPNLLHSDNMQARQNRESEERRRLRNKQRLKAKLLGDDTVIGSGLSTKRSSKEAPRDQRRLRQKGDNKCCCQSRRDTSSQTNDTNKGPMRRRLDPSDSTSAGGGVLTRSASRRLQDRQTAGESFRVGSSSSSSPSSSDLNEEFNEPDCRISTSSLYDSGEEGDNGNFGNEANARNGSLSRTRPFVYSVRGRNPFSLASISRELEPRLLSPPDLQPTRSRIAHIIEPVSSPSTRSSSPSTTSSLSPDLRNRDYDFIRKQVVRRLPSIFANIRNDDLDSDESIDGSTHGEFIDELSSTEDSWEDFVDSCGSADTTSEASWDDLIGGSRHEYCYERSDDELSSASFRVRTPSIFSEMLFGRNGDNEDEDNSSRNGDSGGEPQPSTSKGRQLVDSRRTVEKFCDHKPKIDQEPVASRLRSKQPVGGPSTASTSKQEAASAVSNSDRMKASSSSGGVQQSQMDRPVPSCSRDDTKWPLNNAQSSKHHRCPVHNRRSHDKLKNHCLKHNKVSQTVPSNPASPSSSSNVNTSSTHSSMRLSSEPTSSARGNQTTQRGLFTSRLLYTTRLGTTISLAARHYSGWHSSFRLYERRALDSSGIGTGASASTAHLIGSQLSSRQQQKRKRRTSSSDSSESASATAADPSPARSGRTSGRTSARARYCDCSQQPSNGRRGEGSTSAGSKAGSSANLSVGGGRASTDGEDRASSPVNPQPSSSMGVAQSRPDSARSGCGAEVAFRGQAAYPVSKISSSSSLERNSQSLGGNHLAGPSSTSGEARTPLPPPQPVSGNKRHFLFRSAARKQLATARQTTRSGLVSSSGHQRDQQEPTSTNADVDVDGHLGRGRRHRHLEQGAKSGTPRSGVGRRLKAIGSRRSRRDNGGRSAGEPEEEDNDDNDNDNEGASVHIRHKRHHWRRSGKSLRRRKRNANECERYHNHMSGYILQLPLPRVLHSYLNYERATF